MRLLRATPRALTPLALAAAALALLAPSAALARRSDLLLALLVLATGVGISAADLLRLRRHLAMIALLSIVPLLVLTAVAWVIGQAFGTDVQHGLLAVGLSSSEVATVSLVALSGADATIALGAVTGSLVLAALLGPVAIGAIAGQAGHGSTEALLGRFALVVLAPLAVGVAVRTLRPAIASGEDERESLTAMTVVVLVYAALSGADAAHGLTSALLAAVVFLLVSGLLGWLWHRRMAPGPTAVPGALAIGMRDFAVAAALAEQAFGPRAAAVPGVYGVVMLVAGSIVAGRLAVTRASPPSAAPRRRAARPGR